MEENKPKRYTKKRYDKTLNLRITENLLNAYRDFCDDNGFDLSKRIRLHIINDIAKNQEKIIREKSGDTSGVVNRENLRIITQEILKENKIL